MLKEADQIRLHAFQNKQLVALRKVSGSVRSLFAERAQEEQRLAAAAAAAAVGGAAGGEGGGGGGAKGLEGSVPEDLRCQVRRRCFFFWCGCLCLPGSLRSCFCFLPLFLPLARFLSFYLFLSRARSVSISVPRLVPSLCPSLFWTHGTI